MTSVLPLDSVRQSQLFARLRNLPDPAVPTLVGNLPELCQEASDRMKALPAFHPQFTLHDATHLLRVTELMGKVLGATLETLNAVELALLILAAHFHDQGMMPDAGELQALQGKADFKLQRDTWAVEHPNLREIERQLAQRNLVDEERLRLALRLAELESARLGDYLRLTHGQRSGDLVRHLYGSDPRLKVAGISLADPLARLCDSHVLPAADLTPERLPHDELIGTSPVNLRFLALVLRLADILDFDRERTPDGLYRTLHFTSEVSLAEWEKHRAVQGWVIRPDLVRFEMRFDSPVYERTARQFLDWIDVELSAASEIVRSFPQEFVRYRLDLPLQVDRSRIGPKGAAYVYHDLEFSLSRDEIVKLLMTEQLYGSPSLCVRELLQNALDALRYRKALFQSAGLDWATGRVDMEHGVDEHGHEFLRCTDNGVGMDEGVITRFLTRAGRSYYRSPEFEQERIRFRATGVDFDPCSQFGIGFMSCFMLGNRIRIETRRDYGPDRSYGIPWVVEINGLGGMLTLKKGRAGQEVGTTVVITSRPKPAFLDMHEDQVKLVKILDQYALAVEFPIHARCTITEITAALDLPAGIRRVETFLEVAGVQGCVRIEQNLAEMAPDLNGMLCCAFLVNDGMPAIENNEARWEAEDGLWMLQSGTRIDCDRHHSNDSPICLDGILIVGSPQSENPRFVSPGPSYILNVRGSRKPPITPARTAPPNFRAIYPLRGWGRLWKLLTLAEGRLWAQLLDGSPAPAPEVLWKLRSIHGGTFIGLSSGTIWRHLSVPLSRPRSVTKWCPVRDLGTLQLIRHEDFQLSTSDGRGVGLRKTSPIDNFAKDLTREVNTILLRMVTATMDSGRLRLSLSEPEKPDEAPCERQMFHGLPISFSGGIEGALGLLCAVPFFNRYHPLVDVTERSLAQERLDELETFAQEIFYKLAGRGISEFCAKPECPPRWLKRLAHLYIAVNWSRRDPALRPPYRFWGEKQGWVEITDADFRRWAEAEVEDR
jgi:hypothetical protein